MPDRVLSGLVTVAVATLLAAPATAQSRVFDNDWGISVMPRLGVIQPGGSGPLAGWQPEGLRIQGGPVGGVAFELQTPVSWFAFRGTVDRSLRNNITFDPNRPASPSSFYEPVFGSNATGLQSQYSVGGVLRPLRNFPVRPTGLVGMGVRHWAFDPGNLAESFVPRFPNTQWDRTWHYGAGLEFDARPFLVRTEVLEYRGQAHDGLSGASISDRFIMLSLTWVGGS